MKKNKEIDFIRFILITLVILIHIVYFGNLYPTTKNVILSFLMPTFLLITGYLVNIKKTIKEFSLYLMRIILPYVIFVTGFSILSYYLPVRDGITEISMPVICNKIFITSIGPYWFLHTMIVCGILYYISFKIIARTTFGNNNKLVIFALMLIIVALCTPLLPIKNAIYYFAGAVIRQTKTDFSKFFKMSGFSLFPIVILLSREEFRDWGAISILVVVFCTISFLRYINSLVHHSLIYKYMTFIGQNTLPIYIFHPIFTMIAKFYLPFFKFDPSGLIFTLTTIILCISGSLLMAMIMDKTRTSYIFGKKNILR